MINEITLDLTGCRSPLLLHLIIKEAFGFPDFYGKNLDALWDCLRDYCREDSIIYVKGTRTLPKEWREYMEKVYEIFKDVEKEVENVKFEIVS